MSPKHLISHRAMLEAGGTRRRPNIQSPSTIQAPVFPIPLLPKNLFTELVDLLNTARNF